MFIEAIVLLALLCTVVITFLLKISSQNNLVDLKDLPYTTPLGIFLTFICSVLFSASLVMVMHGRLQENPISFDNPAKIIASKIAQGAASSVSSSHQLVGHLPENAVAETRVSLPSLNTLHAGYQPIAFANDKSVPAEPNVEPAVVVNEEPTTTTPATTTTATNADSEKSVRETVSNPELTASKKIKSSEQPKKIDSDDIYVIQINGELKGYTADFLNNLTIYKDLIGDIRVMITVSESRVEFYNLDSNRNIAVERLSLEQWESNYPNGVLVDYQPSPADELLIVNHL